MSKPKFIELMEQAQANQDNLANNPYKRDYEETNLTLIAEATRIALPVSEYNSDTDVVFLFRGGGFQTGSVEYNVVDDGGTWYAEFVGDPWPVDTEINIAVFVNRKTLGDSFADGNALDNLSVPKTKLYQSLQDEITENTRLTSLITDLIRFEGGLQ